MTSGYQTLREHMQRDPLPPWHERLKMAFWRGLNNWQQKHRSEHPGPQPSLPIGSFESGLA